MKENPNLKKNYSSKYDAVIQYLYLNHVNNYNFIYKLSLSYKWIIKTKKECKNKMWITKQYTHRILYKNNKKQINKRWIINKINNLYNKLR